MDTLKREGSTILLVVSSSREFHQAAREALQKSGLEPRFKLVFCSYGDSFPVAPPSIALFDLADADTAHIDFIQNFSASLPKCKIICTGNNLNVDQVLYLIKIGVHHFVKTPFDLTEISTLLKNILSECESQKPLQEPAKKARLITVYSLKGGSGVTMLTINLAIALHKQAQGLKTAVCDLGSQTGDVSTYLNLNPKYTIRDVIDSASRLDRSLLAGVLAPHESGVRVLSSPTLDQEPISSYCLQEWETILSMLRHDNDFIFVDSAHTDEALLQYTLTQSDMILLIGNLDVPSLKGLLLGISKLARLKIDPEKIKIIINRYNAKNQLDIKEFSKNAHHPVSCKLPNQYNTCIESVNTGKPLNHYFENSDIAKIIQQFAGEILKEFSKHHTGKANSEANSQPEQTSKKGLWRLIA